MAKAPMKKGKPSAVMLVVMKKGSGKKMRGGGCEGEDDMEEYRKGGLVKKKTGRK
jgi:hypothetical protein